MIKPNYSFRDYLSDKFAEQYDGLDDEMPDAEAEWACNLDPNDLIEYAEKWHKLKKEFGQ